MNTAATEIGDNEQTPFNAKTVENYDPSPDTQLCRCGLCNPGWYARQDALDKLDKLMEAWSDALVDTENKYTEAGDDPLFDVLHSKLNAMKGANTDAINFEDDRIRDLRGE